MGSRGQKIDELYIDIGLNIAQLQLDFDTAGKTVSQTIAQLNSKANNIQLKLDTDLAKMDGVGKELDKLQAKHAAINSQLEIQKQKEQMLIAVMKEAQKNTGIDSGATQRAERNLLKQQRTVAVMEAEMRKLNVQLKLAGANTGYFETRMATARERVKNLSDGFTLMNAKFAAFMAVATTGAGLFTLTHSSVESGENLYRLTQRLHTTSAEAAKLNRVFQLTGTDVTSVIPLFARLDKQIELAGEDGNNTSLAMARFGISLTDQAGNLLPLNEQLAQLAKGYKNATAAGQEEAFTAEVLGARGAALIPILEQYDDLMLVSSRVKITGLLNPEEAHRTYLKWKEMEMEAGQLKSALGAALMPVAEAMLPEVTLLFQTLIEEIKDNKDGIKDAILGWGDALKLVASALGFVGEQFHKVKEHADANNWLAENHPMALPIAMTPFIGGAIMDEMYGEEYLAYKKQQAELAEQKRAEEIAAAAESEQQAKAERDKVRAAQASLNYVANQKIRQAQEKLNTSELQKSLKTLDKEIAQMGKQGADKQLIDEYKLAKAAKIYEDFNREVIEKTEAIYRSDLENRLKVINQEKKAYIQKGLDEEEATEWAEASKAKIMEQWEGEVASKIDAVWKTELQNRLDAIDREKNAWIQKGLDEVKATQWAEKEKLDAKRNAALAVLQSQKEELKAFQRGGEQGLANYYKQEHGLTDRDLAITQEELAAFQEARKSMLENLLPNFAPVRWSESPGNEMYGEDYSAALEGMNQEIAGMRQEMGKLNDGDFYKDEKRMTEGKVINTTQNFGISVNIENAVTQDNEGMRILADTVADRIRPAVEDALGGDSNSYSDR